MVFQKVMKLVRDKIPDKIVEDGGNPIVRTLEDEEFEMHLGLKLMEEFVEVTIAESYSDKVEELADLFTVFSSILEFHNVDYKDIVKKAEEKRDRLGSFLQGKFLMGVRDE